MSQQQNGWAVFIVTALFGVVLCCGFSEWRWRNASLITHFPSQTDFSARVAEPSQLGSSRSGNSLVTRSLAIGQRPAGDSAEMLSDNESERHDMADESEPRLIELSPFLSPRLAVYLQERRPFNNRETNHYRLVTFEGGETTGADSSREASQPQKAVTLSVPDRKTPKPLPENNVAQPIPEEGKTRTPSVRLSSSRKEVATDSARTIAGSKEPLAANSGKLTSEQLRRSSWPRPQAVYDQLEHLRKDPRLEDYVKQLEGKLDEFQSLGGLSDPQVLPALERLKTRAGTMPAISSELPYFTQGLLMKVQFAIQKRVAIWTAIHFAALETPENWIATKTVDPHRLLMAKTTVHNLSQLLSSDPAGLPWHEYLSLNRLNLALEDGEISKEESEEIRQTLRRFESSRLGQQQRVFLDEEPMASLVRVLGPLVQEELTHEQLLKVIEAYESNPLGLYGRAIARTLEAYRWSEKERDNVLASNLEVNFRNANLRFTVSEEFLNRLIPEMADIQEPVNDWMLGARVTGTSETSNRLRIQLVPDEERLHFGLQANGVVLSRTRAIKDGFVFYNRGQAKFRASKFLSFDQNGVRIMDSDAEAVSAQETLDVQSNLDGVPVVGHVARMLAMQQKSGKEGTANRLVENKVAATARERLDREIQKKLATARKRLNVDVIEPLHELDLEPQPIAMKTTEERIVIRYRLASAEQLGSNSPRPYALSNSLISFQIHESVISNFAGGLDVGQQEFDLPKLVDFLGSKLDRPITLEDDVDQELHIVFPEAGWLEAHFDDGKVRIRVTFKELGLDGGTPWKNLTAEAVYSPKIEGNQLQLFRAPDTSIVVKGRRLRMRDQFAIRGIMNKVFDPEQVIDVIPEPIVNDPRLAGTMIGQLVIENGWLAVSIVDVANVEESLPSFDDREAKQRGRPGLNGRIR